MALINDNMFIDCEANAMKEHLFTKRIKLKDISIE